MLTATKPSDRLLDAVSSYEQIFVVTHDNPDPDAIATGWAIKFLLDSKLKIPTRLIGGGAIVRAENRHMVRLLRPPLELVDRIDLNTSTAILLVDCGAEAQNHLICRQPDHIVGVIDHHQAPTHRPLRFRDLRSEVAASATLAAGYLQEQHLQPDTSLATALVYAIRTETGGETQYSDDDLTILRWLAELADPSLMAEIENAPLPVDYFGDLILALQNTWIYGDAALCLLPRAQGPEIVGEVADLLVRCEGCRRVLCCAVYQNDVLVSVRTERFKGNATDLLHATIQGLGRGGGHEHRAGGKLAAKVSGPKVPRVLRDDLRRRWLSACGISERDGITLIPRREIVENLQYGAADKTFR